MNQPHFNFSGFKFNPPCPLLCASHVMRAMLASLILLTGLVSQGWASFPVSATLNATDTQPLSWIGTALGPASATSTPLLCREGIDCDTFIMTIGGSPADWTGKIALIRIDWQLPTSNFDVYILKETTGSPVIVNQSINGVTGGLTSETVSLSPSANGTGRYLVRVMYTQADFQDQYRAVASVRTLLGQNGMIVFERSYGGGNKQVATMNPDGSNFTQVAITNSNFAPAWSPDGTKIAFFRQEKFTVALFVMDAYGNNQTKIATVIAPLDRPVWSPDGTRILFNDRVINNYEIFVVPADGSLPQRPLSLNTADDFYPSWSPDGSKIVFSSNRTTYRAIFVMNADGSNQTQLTNTYDYFPRWSPDGTKILFVTAGPISYDIFVINPDGSGQTRLTTDSEMDWNPVWSPDGTRIAFERGPSVYVMNANGSGQTNLSTPGGTDWQPRWSPDGTKILFKSFRDETEGIWVMNANGTGPTQLTSNGYDDQYEWQDQ